MKFIWKFLLLLAASALLGALTAPWVHSIIHKCNLLTFSFDKILNRSVLAWLILLLIIFRKRLFTIPLAQLGLSRSPGWGKELGYGILFGTVSIMLLFIVLYVFDARILDFRLFSPKYIKKILEYGSGVIFIGFFEEIFFRGFVLQGFLQTQRRWVAVVLSSFFYAVTHFLHPINFHVETDVSVWFSLQSLFRFLDPLANMEKATPYFFGLFLLGIVLAYARLKTERLYFSIGLHAIWVFWIKIDSGFIHPTYLGGEHWFFGDGKIINGITGWCFLFVVFVWIHYCVPWTKGTVLNRDGSPIGEPSLLIE